MLAENVTSVLDLFKTRPPSLIGVDIASTSLKLVELADAGKRLGTRNRNVALALPAAMVITKKIIVAAGQREEDLELTVEAEANQYISLIHISEPTRLLSIS